MTRASTLARARVAGKTPAMTSVAQRILEEAMALPEDERVALVEALSDTLDRPAEALSPEWKAEVLTRIEAVERGDVEPVEWTDVEARIRSTIAQR
ncbi:MAG: addiction module protein [Deltaproteobacteria bacterium]|nr:addiction module protein [Nannocystaceae bacterium]